MIFSNRFGLVILAAVVAIAASLLFSRQTQSPAQSVPVAANSPTPGASPLINEAPTPSPSTSSVATPTPLVSSSSLSAQDREQLRVADDVLAKAADNDPRMDKELKVLSAPVQEQLRARYGQIKAESRNSKGTVVFLLGRNLKEPGDLDFLASVVSEPPCLSLADCTRPPSATGMNEDDHHNGGLSVALAYPQLVALHSVSRLIERTPNLSDQPLMKKKVLEFIQKGLASPTPEVAAAARELQRRLR